MFELTKYLNLGIMFEAFFIILFFTLAIYLWNFLLVKFTLRSFNQIQNISIHDSKNPRLGGIILISSLFLWDYFKNNNISEVFLIYVIPISIPLIFIGVIEDIIVQVKPIIRLFFLSISVVIFLLTNPWGFPEIEITIFNNFLNYPIIKYIIFYFAILTVTNGFNLIDGANGLASAAALSSLGCILYLSYLFNHSFIFAAALILCAFIIIFLLFNFPFGIIFLGDTGAYFLGFYISVLTIILFAIETRLNTWGAGIILFYPCFEVAFSFFRKLKKNISPTVPDSEHLHLLIFWILQKNKPKSRSANCLVMPFLSIIWASPLLFTIVASNNLILIWILFLLQVLIYLFLYSFVKRIQE